MGPMVRVHLHHTSRVRQCTVEVPILLGFLVSLLFGSALGRVLTPLSERNMYLAEDRILCFEIVTKKREGWV